MGTVLLPRNTATRVRASSALAAWHLLSLDAPTVAAAWLLLFARCFGTPLPAAAVAALALAVWMLYAADRMADAAAGTAALEARHHFHHRHRRAFATALAVCAPILALLTWSLPGALRGCWLLLGVPLAVYVWAVHGRRFAALPKEAAVGVFFAAACMAPAWLAGAEPHWAMTVAAAGFAALCALNCFCIARWESRGAVRPHLPITILTTVVAAGATVLVAADRASLGIALAGGALLLLLLDRSTRLSVFERRCLADVALLTPVPMLLLRHAAMRA